MPHARVVSTRSPSFALRLFRVLSVFAFLITTAANFTAYTELKKALQAYQPQYPDGGLPAWQTSIIGLISGAVGPFTNAPIDTIKYVGAHMRLLLHGRCLIIPSFRRTRIQRATALKGETAWTRFSTVAAQMFREEGPSAFYKGITPRVARVAPGYVLERFEAPRDRPDLR